MLSRSGSRNRLPNVDFAIADVHVGVSAPPAVIEVLRATLAMVSEPIAPGEPTIAIVAHLMADFWEVTGSGGARKVLDRRSAPAQVAGTIVSTALSAVADCRGLSTTRATVIEKDGQAIAMIGGDWESAITLGSHFHTRGWRFLGGDHLLADPTSLRIVPFKKSLYLNSSSISNLPLAYRRALEASPWYVTPHGIAFYAVDPAKAQCGLSWATGALLRAVVVVDGDVADLPSLESWSPALIGSELLQKLCIDWSLVEIANLTLGPYIPSCDLIERWFATIVT